jgi:hypothetical protein
VILTLSLQIYCEADADTCLSRRSKSSGELRGKQALIVCQLCEMCESEDEISRVVLNSGLAL